jgi:hypothetical protein
MTSVYLHGEASKHYKVIIKHFDNFCAQFPLIQMTTLNLSAYNIKCSCYSQFLIADCRQHSIQSLYVRDLSQYKNEISGSHGGE